MATLKDKEADWLYEKFQSVSKAHNNYLYLLLFISAFSFVGFEGAELQAHISLFGLDVNRTMMLSGCALLGAWLIVAYCGNYDMGEALLNRLAETLSCQYEDLNLVDTHPNLFDFAQFARGERMRRRGVMSRCTVSLLYPVALLTAWAWFVFLALVQFLDAGGPWTAKFLCLIALCTLFVAMRRMTDFVGRRWRTLLAIERAAQQADGQTKTGT